MENKKRFLQLYSGKSSKTLYEEYMDYSEEEKKYNEFVYTRSVIKDIRSLKSNVEIMVWIIVISLILGIIVGLWN